MASTPEAKRRRLEGKQPPPASEKREIRVVGFLGISDYGLGQFEVLAERYTVAFATTKRKPAAHAAGLDGRLAERCASLGIEFLGSVDANSAEMVERARRTDLVVIGGYDAILKGQILDAPRYGVINTHLGVLPLNRGCFPTLWGQLHGLSQGYTTYRVGTAVDHGDVLELYQAETGLGGLRDTNRAVYDALAEQAVAGFGDTLDRFEAGDALAPCQGREAYHRKGLPNDGWLSFRWSDAFLRRFSLALDFAPYLPGRTRIVTGVAGTGETVTLAIEAVGVAAAGSTAKVGEVLAVDGQEFTVCTRESVARCRLCAGPLPAVGAVLASGRPSGSDGEEAACAHPVDVAFEGDVLPLERYLR